MADTLRRLTNTSSFSVLQDKLESWHKDYHVISCDQNLNRCCELIELTAKIQGQLFAILNLTAAEGGHYAGVETLKMRLLPWLGTCFSMARPSVTDDTSLQLIQDSVEKDRRIRELSASHDSDMLKMDTQLCSTRLQLDSIRAELADAQKELDETKSKSATTLLATEDEILQLKADLRSAHEQVEIYKRKLDALDDYERQIRLLRDEVSYLSTEKAMLQERLVRSRSPSPLPRLSRSSSPVRSESPTRAQLTSSSRHARLISRFSDLYAVERLEAQAMLRRYIADLDMVQKIIFIAVVDVINAMNVNPRISFPPEVDFVLISALIRDTCRMAFAMQTLDPPLDLAFASDGELYNDNKYRRSYDSEFTAPLVMHHVWPALVEGDAVVVKGEAVTRRGALWNRSRSRSASPVRSRSLSPSRSLAFNGNEEPVSWTSYSEPPVNSDLSVNT
ncbi:Mitochondria-eating protein [Nibea albiflora]|uniref:Mitochondria-eating protein n=1 Tax=Nibea albiflora TaxID=240163 RepID=A0ACB7ENN9_NIBAL|nr:Mitochondria-eating protein [Nibea albiflora]